jgi:helicase
MSPPLFPHGKRFPRRLRYLPHEMLNPAQAAAIPHVLDHAGHLVVVAPTGAGKTVIGRFRSFRSFRSRSA